MREVKVLHRGVMVGMLPVPDSFRPPIEQADLDLIPAAMIGRSRSWLFDIRPGDLRLALAGEGRAREVVVIARDQIGPGDIGCLVGFRAAEAHPHYAVDEERMAIAEDAFQRAVREARGVAE